MVKFFKHWVIGFVLLVGILFSYFLPCVKSSVVYAQNSEGESIQYLINPEMTANYWRDTHNGKLTEVENFTPFDEQSKTRMSGKSIVPEVSDKYNQISEVTYNLIDNGGLDLSNGVSLGIWVYFYDISIHGLEIKLSVDEDNYFLISLTKSQLINCIKKNDGVNEQAFAWNYLEIPFKNEFIVGSIAEDNKLKEFNSVTFSYKTGDEIDAKANFSSLRFYGLYLHSSSVETITATEKQDYAIYSFNFWEEQTINNVIKGDSLQTFPLSKAVNYAWIGANNLLSSGFFSWQVVVISPSGKTLNYNFGETIVFDENGVYTISYSAKSTSSQDQIGLYDSINIYVRADNLLYFDFSSYNMNVGDSIDLTIRADVIVNVESIEIISIDLSNNNIVVESTDDPLIYKITANGSGESDVKINFKLTRKDQVQEKTYTTTTAIKVVDNSNSNAVIMIVLWISLGVCVLIGLFVFVKAVIKARNLKVK